MFQGCSPAPGFAGANRDPGKGDVVTGILRLSGLSQPSRWGGQAPAAALGLRPTCQRGVSGSQTALPRGDKHESQRGWRDRRSRRCEAGWEQSATPFVT